MEFGNSIAELRILISELNGERFDLQEVRNVGSFGVFWLPEDYSSALVEGKSGNSVCEHLVLRWLGLDGRRRGIFHYLPQKTNLSLLLLYFVLE